MSLAGVQDRLARGMGRAAFAIGDRYALFRPQGPGSPLRPGTLLLHLKVALHGAGRSWQQSPGYGDALWSAVLDTAYSSQSYSAASWPKGRRRHYKGIQSKYLHRFASSA